MQSAPSPIIFSRQELILELIRREIRNHRTKEMSVGRKLPFESDPVPVNAILVLIGFNQTQRGESVYSFHDGIMGQVLALSNSVNDHLIHQMAAGVYKQLLVKHMDYIREYSGE